MVSIAKGINANRVVEGAAIIHPVGNPNLAKDKEKQWRKDLMAKALKALEADVKKE